MNSPLTTAIEGTAAAVLDHLPSSERSSDHQLFLKAKCFQTAVVGVTNEWQDSGHLCSSGGLSESSPRLGTDAGLIQLPGSCLSLSGPFREPGPPKAVMVQCLQRAFPGAQSDMEVSFWSCHQDVTRASTPSPCKNVGLKDGRWTCSELTCLRKLF